jgi:hypothetical protein
MAANFKLRKELFKKLQHNASGTIVPIAQPPEYCLYYVIHLLAHQAYLLADSPKFVQSTQYVTGTRASMRVCATDD